MRSRNIKDASSECNYFTARKRYLDATNGNILYIGKSRVAHGVTKSNGKGKGRKKGTVGETRPGWGSRPVGSRYRRNNFSGYVVGGTFIREKLPRYLWRSSDRARAPAQSFALDAGSDVARERGACIAGRNRINKESAAETQLKRSFSRYSER